MIEIFYECEDSDIENYISNTTPDPRAADTDTVISKLKSRSDKLFTCFKNNHTKANPEKRHLLLSLKKPNEYFGSS